MHRYNLWSGNTKAEEGKREEVMRGLEEKVATWRERPVHLYVVGYVVKTL